MTDQREQRQEAAAGKKHAEGPEAAPAAQGRPAAVRRAYLRLPAAELAAYTLEYNTALANAHILASGPGHDEGPYVDKVEAVFGLRGEPYCAMGQAFNLYRTLALKSGVPLTADNIVDELKAIRPFADSQYVAFDPSVRAMIQLAIRRGQWRPFAGVHGIGPADYVVFNFGTAVKPQRHIAQFARYDGSHMWTVEWNTSPGSAGDRESDPSGVSGCFVKERAPDAGTVEGSIHWHGQ